MEFLLLPQTQKELAEAALTITVNSEDAADILSEVACVLLEKGETLGSVIDPMPFLKACVRNEARNWVKKEARKTSVDPMLLEELMGRRKAHIDAHTFELMDWIKKCLAGYEDDRREAFLKYHLDGYSLEMLESEYGVSKNTLAQQFSRMRSKLKANNPALFLVLILHRL